MLAGAFIQQYFNYLGGKLYAQDSLKIKLLLHAVMGLAVVSPAPLGLLPPPARSGARLQAGSGAQASTFACNSCLSTIADWLTPTRTK